MKLNDICSNERFAKGELYAHHDEFMGYLNRYISATGSSFIYTYKFNGKLNSPSSRMKSVKYGLNLQITDFTRDDWKLYELIDGKMVEYIENLANEQKDNTPEFEKTFQKNVRKLFAKIEDTAVNQKLTTTESNSSEIPNSSDKKADIQCDGCGKDIPDSPIDGTMCKECINFSPLVDYPVKGACKKCLKTNEILHIDDDFCWECHYRKGIMQPIEAARWMRENPGKIIEAVEDPEVKLMNDDGVIQTVFINGDQIEKMYQRLDWGFFAYTYRILEE